MARVVVITAARLSAGRARQREKCPRARRPIKPGALYAALASADDGSAEDTDTTRSPRRRARHARLGSVPRPHRVRRLLPRCDARCASAADANCWRRDSPGR